METYTIADDAHATNLTKKAIRNRVGRGQVRAVPRDGVRCVPRSELERAGVALNEAVSEPAEGREAGLRQAADPTAEILRVERQAGELGQLCLLTRESDSLREEREHLARVLHEAGAPAPDLEDERDVESQAADERLCRLAFAGSRERRRLLHEVRLQEVHTGERQ